MSLGVRRAHVTFGKRGTRTTVGVPGTGVSYTAVTPHRNEPTEMAASVTPPSVEPMSSGSHARGWLWIIVVTVVFVVILIGVMR